MTKIVNHEGKSRGLMEIYAAAPTHPHLVLRPTMGALADGQIVEDTAVGPLSFARRVPGVLPGNNHRDGAFSTRRAHLVLRPTPGLEVVHVAAKDRR